jgi:hypothetical protein
MNNYTHFCAQKWLGGKFLSANSTTTWGILRDDVMSYTGVKQPAFADDIGPKKLWRHKCHFQWLKFKFLGNVPELLHHAHILTSSYSETSGSNLD